MHMKIIPMSLLALSLSVAVGSASAAGDEENLAKLGAFQKTGTEAGEVIPQNSKFADNVRKNINFQNQIARRF